jgi:calcineurin-like phosphoesterase family protein
MLDNLRRVLTKKSVLYVLGDVAFTMEAMAEFEALPGRKVLVRGNHDNFQLEVYKNVFEDILGLARYKEFWLSHAPVHPNELRGKINLHGHVHFKTIEDSRYINICPENLIPKFGRPYITLDEVRETIAKGNK